MFLRLLNRFFQKEEENIMVALKRNESSGFWKRRHLKFSWELGAHASLLAATVEKGKTAGGMMPWWPKTYFLNQGQVSAVKPQWRRSRADFLGGSMGIYQCHPRGKNPQGPCQIFWTSLDSQDIYTTLQRTGRPNDEWYWGFYCSSQTGAQSRCITYLSPLFKQKLITSKEQIIQMVMVFLSPSLFFL